MTCAWCNRIANVFRVKIGENVCLCCFPYEMPCKLQELLDEAVGSFSFVSRGVRLTYDFRKIYNRLIIAREWK